MTLIRSYRSRVDPDRIPEYESFEKNVGVGMVAKQPGCLHVAFGRVVEASEPTYVFLSVWRDRESLERARATPAWKDAVRGLVEQNFERSPGIGEHVDVVRWADGPASKPPQAPAKARPTKRKPTSKPKKKGTKRKK